MKTSVRSVVVAVLLAIFVVGCNSRPELVSGRSEWGPVYRIQNADRTVDVAPQIGRIVQVDQLSAFPNMLLKRNLLWTDRATPIMTFGPFVNYGGDKMWTWPQRNWGWPPPVAIDVGPFEVVESSKDRMTLAGPVDAKSGLRARREIAIDGALVRQTYTLKRVEPRESAKPVAAWSITQIEPPDELYVRRMEGHPHDATLMDKGNATGTRFNDKWVRVNPVYDNSKLGFAGDAILAIVGPRALLIERLPDPQDAQLDAPVAAQIYFRELPKGATAPTEKTYVELEFIGPTLPLDFGQSTSLRTVWHVMLPAEARRLLER